MSSAPFLAHLDTLRKLAGEPAVSYPHNDANYPVTERLLTNVPHSKAFIPFGTAEPDATRFPEVILTDQKEVGGNRHSAEVWYKYEKIPGPAIKSTRMDPDGIPVEVIRQKTFRSYITPSESITFEATGGIGFFPSFTRNMAGEVTGVTIVSGGSGYPDYEMFSPLTDNVINPTGSGALISCLATNGVITSVTILSPGTGYQVPFTNNGYAMTWTRVSIDGEGGSTVYATQVTEMRRLNGNWVTSEEKDEDGVTITVKKRLRRVQDIAADETLNGGVWTRTSVEPMTDLVAHEVVKSRAIPGNPLRDRDVDSDSAPVLVERTLVEASTVTASEAVNAGVLTVIRAKPVTTLVAHKIVTTRALPGNTVTTYEVDGETQGQVQIDTTLVAKPNSTPTPTSGVAASLNVTVNSLPQDGDNIRIFAADGEAFRFEFDPITPGMNSRNGSITFNAEPLDGDTIVLKRPSGTPATFEFDNDGIYTAGRIPVALGGNALLTIQNFGLAVGQVSVGNSPTVIPTTQAFFYSVSGNIVTLDRSEAGSGNETITATGGRPQIATAFAEGTITNGGNATVTVTGAAITGSPLTFSVAVAGMRQVETATVAGTIVQGGNAKVTVTIAGADTVVSVPVAGAQQVETATIVGSITKGGTCAVTVTVGGTPTTTNVTVAGTQQVETATVAGTVGTDGNADVTVTSAALPVSPYSIAVPVLTGDTASVVAGKMRSALAADSSITDFFAVSGATDKIILTRLVALANDSTLNIATSNGTATGITTTATSANTTAGVAGDTPAQVATKIAAAVTSTGWTFSAVGDDVFMTRNAAVAHDGTVNIAVDNNTCLGLTPEPTSVSTVTGVAGDTANGIATKIRTALNATSEITNRFTVSGATDKVILTATVARANDTTLNIAVDNDTCTGITSAASSANTTAGIAGDTPSAWAAKVRAAISGTSPYTVGGSNESITLTRNSNAANDDTLLITLDNGTCEGIVATSSTITQTGAALPFTITSWSGGANGSSVQSGALAVLIGATAGDSAGNLAAVITNTGKFNAVAVSSVVTVTRIGEGMNFTGKTSSTSRITVGNWANGTYGTSLVQYHPLSAVHGRLVTTTLLNYQNLGRSEGGTESYHFPKIIDDLTFQFFTLPSGQVKIVRNYIGRAARTMLTQTVREVTYGPYNTLLATVPVNLYTQDLEFDGVFLPVREMNVLNNAIYKTFTTGTNNPIYGYIAEVLSFRASGTSAATYRGMIGTFQPVSCRIEPWKYGLWRRVIIRVKFL